MATRSTLLRSLRRGLVISTAAVSLIVSACAGGGEPTGAPSSIDDRGAPDGSGSTSSTGGVAPEAASPDGIHDSPAHQPPSTDGEPATLTVVSAPASPIEIVDDRRLAALVAAEDAGSPLTGYVSGGPPPDGIPSIDAPEFWTVDTARATRGVGINDDEFVVAVTVGADHRAYPIRILIWHEIVNDTIGSTPVVISYCPLCNSALAFDRRVGGRVLSFGVSGLLRDGALVMFDRQTESLWPQVAGRAHDGTLAGEELVPIPAQLQSFGDFRAVHPDGLVLSDRTGVERDYGRNPYVNYDRGDSPSIGLFDGVADPTYPPLTRVVGVTIGDAAIHLVRDDLAESGGRSVEIEEVPIVVTFSPGARSPLDTSELAEGTPIGAVGVFDRRLDGLTLDLVADGPGIVRDAASGSRFSATGVGIDGTYVGRQLTPMVHLDTFWFAWAAYRPSSSAA